MCVKKIFMFLFITFASLLFINNVDASNIKMTVTGIQDYDYVNKVVQSVNHERTVAGLNTLVLDKDLTERAMIRAAEIYDLFSHTRPDGTPCFTVLNGLYYSLAAENIAEGQTTAFNVMEAWMNSTGHRANILNKDVKAIGVGHINVNGRNYWVQLFSDNPQDIFTKTGINYTSITFNKDDTDLDNLDNIIKDTFDIDVNSTINLDNNNKTKNILKSSREVIINDYSKVEIPITSYTFTSLNTSVATVDSNGLVSAVGNGNTTIRVVYNDKQYDFKVNVNIDEEPRLFNDVKKSDWFYSAVKYVYENNIIKGYTNGNFGPNDKLTRAMIVTILHRMEKEHNVSTNNKFSDVGSSWYTNAINWASQNKIVMGYGDGTFKPNNNITRQDLMVILYRYAKYKGKDMTANTDISNYKDYNKIDNYAKEAMKWAVSKKILYGNKDGLLNPKGNATRAQVAAIIERYMKNI